MNTTTSFEPTTTSDVIPSPTNDPSEPTPHVLNPVVSFIIGFAIILAASLLNASGLNLTKLDHIRTSALPKSARRSDWARPLWILGMFLYVVSQLVGKYVAPLGSTSLIFNFIFASLLLGTPVTKTDVYGTLVIVVGVIGIVSFGSVNSGLETDMSLARLSKLWGRPGWILFLLFMSAAIFLAYTVIGQLDAVLNFRAELNSEPQLTALPFNAGRVARARHTWNRWMFRLREKLEERTSYMDDKNLAWNIGVGWACIGGFLAGGCLVFAKAGVKLISGSLSLQNEGSQFVHPAAIITFIYLAITAVFQIVCLNRGLKAYDPTLVVPVFYGLYTASGFLDSLIFNNETDAYQGWTLFFIGVSILILIGGVVLLTNKKPPSTGRVRPTANGVGMSTLPVHNRDVSQENDKQSEHEVEGLRKPQPGEEVVWQLGDDSDDDEGPSQPTKDDRAAPRDVQHQSQDDDEPNEEHGLIPHAEEQGDSGFNTDPNRDKHSGRLNSPDVEFGDWEDASRTETHH
ncbi:hypothetical protein SISSUDRAFT_1057486 [Sistotremastrum suecicum HHB10207 ss-3]|uniref:DUF803-domain-containing protein n=1 Tax=Sistotremastrum suecicum HHB10207 ss-3 TaxID=1314776 RepID=A0A166I792_9AGAM|nr:hypothetical protein SISSUDRAFT_1057486 [Sistotremastrum suecicum HHB10207 ss-3]